MSKLPQRGYFSSAGVAALSTVPLAVSFAPLASANTGLQAKVNHVPALLRVPGVAPKVVSHFEVAPQGTIAELQRALALFRAAQTAPISDNRSRGEWLHGVLADLDQVAADALSEAGAQISAPVLSACRSVLDLCANFGAPAPLLAHDDEGGIEVFFKQQHTAVLLAVRPEGTINFFGDGPDEQWRARYSASGSAWKRQIPHLLAELR